MIRQDDYLLESFSFDALFKTMKSSA